MEEISEEGLQDFLEGLVVYEYIKNNEEEVVRAISLYLVESGVVASEGGDALAVEVLQAATDRRDPRLAFGIVVHQGGQLFGMPCYFGYDEGRKVVEIVFYYDSKMKSGYVRPKPKLIPAIVKPSTRGASTFRIVNGTVIR